MHVYYSIPNKDRKVYALQMIEKSVGRQFELT